MKQLLFFAIFLLSLPLHASEEIYTLLEQNKAVEAYELLKKTELQTIEEVLLLGDLTRTHGTLEEAILILEGGTQTYPTDPRPHFELGVTHIWNSEPDKAYTRFLRALKLDPSFVAARINLARVAIWEGRYSEAKTELARLDIDAPNNVEVLLLRGLYSESFLDRTSAAKHYNNALQLDPGNAEALRASASLDTLWKLELTLGATARLVDDQWRFGPSVGATYRFTPRLKCSVSATALNAPSAIAEASASCGAIFDNRRFLTVSATTFNLAEAAGVEADWSERWTDALLTSLRLRYGIDDNSVAIRGQTSYRVGFITPMVGWRVSLPDVSHTAIGGLALDIESFSVRNETYYELASEVYGSSIAVNWKLNADIRFGVSVAARFATTTSTQTSTQVSYAF